MQALQTAHPRAPDAASTPHDVLVEHAVHVCVFHETRTHVSAVVPRLQPLLYLFILHPLLCAFVVLQLQAVECGALAVEQADFPVEDARTEVVALQQVADAIGQVVVLPPGNHAHTCHADGTIIPVWRPEVEKLAHARAPVHVQRELAFRRIHERIVSDFLLDCTHIVAFLRFSRMPLSRAISCSPSPYMIFDTSL